MKGYEWLNRYITGTYNYKDKFLHNIPISVEKELSRTIGKPGKVYRGYLFGDVKTVVKWYNSEVYEYKNDYKIGDIIKLNIRSISSWTKNKSIAERFARDTGGVGFIVETSTSFSDEIFSEVVESSYVEDQFNEEEVILKPGKFKCKIVDIFMEHRSVDKLSDWVEFFER